MTFIMNPYRFGVAGFSFTTESFEVASDGAAGDQAGGAYADIFGAAVCLSADGNTLALGAPLDDNAGGTDAGAVYIFVRGAGNSWTEQTKLTPASQTAGERFGNSVALSPDGNMLIVGAPDSTASGTGRAFYFTRSGTTWSEAQTITGSSVATGDCFGNGVAINKDADTVCIAAPFRGATDTGRIFIFSLSGGSWTEDTFFTPTNSTWQGIYVSLSANGNTAIISSRGRKAAVWVRSGGSWSQQTVLDPGASGGGATSLSTAISADGLTAVLGIPAVTSGGFTNAGEVYVYNYSGGSWSLTATLVSDNQASSEQFGCGVACNENGTKIIVGARGFGYAYVFELDGTWGLVQTLVRQAGRTTSEDYGETVSMAADGETLAIGAPGYDTPGTDAGGVYIYAGS